METKCCKLHTRIEPHAPLGIRVTGLKYGLNAYPNASSAWIEAMADDCRAAHKLLNILSDLVKGVEIIRSAMPNAIIPPGIENAITNAKYYLEP